MRTASRSKTTSNSQVEDNSDSHHKQVNLETQREQDQNKNNLPLVSDKDRQAFAEDGYLVIRGLFSPQEIDAMTAAADALVELVHKRTGQFTFSVIEKNVVYGDLPQPASEPPQTRAERLAAQQARDMIVQTFRQVALHSKLPHICAQLMELDPQTQCLRLLRDVFLAKDVSTDTTCDWHVDDQTFWPESFVSTASQQSSRNQDGINVWLALDDYSAQHGGSMIVSKGSHRAEWRHDAYQAIGQDRTQDGGMTKDDVLDLISAITENSKSKKQKRAKVATCSLQEINPRIRAKAEANKVELDLQKGDCLIATRLLFHRTAQVTKEGVQYYRDQSGCNSKDGNPKPHLHRYSLRYVPGTARLPRGDDGDTTMADLAAQWKSDNAGRTLDEISQLDHPAWYPQTWPQLERHLHHKLNRLASHQVVQAKAHAKASFEDLMAQVAALQQESSTTATDNGKNNSSM